MKAIIVLMFVVGLVSSHPIETMENPMNLKIDILCLIKVFQNIVGCVKHNQTEFSTENFALKLKLSPDTLSSEDFEQYYEFYDYLESWIKSNSPESFWAYWIARESTDYDLNLSPEANVNDESNSESSELENVSSDSNSSLEQNIQKGNHDVINK